MSACQSQSHAGTSCAPGALAPRPQIPSIPDGTDAIRITETVVAKVAEMLAEEGADAWLRETISRIQTRLRAELPLEWSSRLAILRSGRRPRTRYGLASRVLHLKPSEK